MRDDPAPDEAGIGSASGCCGRSLPRPRAGRRQGPRGNIGALALLQALPKAVPLSGEVPSWTRALPHERSRDRALHLTGVERVSTQPVGVSNPICPQDVVVAPVNWRARSRETARVRTTSPRQLRRRLGLLTCPRSLDYSAEGRHLLAADNAHFMEVSHRSCSSERGSRGTRQTRLPSCPQRLHGGCEGMPLRSGRSSR